MKKEEVLKFISDTKTINEHVRNILKEINKINPEKYWAVPEKGTFFVRFHEESNYDKSIIDELDAHYNPTHISIK